MNSLSEFLVDSILEDVVTADKKHYPIIDTVIPKEVVQEWVIQKLPKLLNEISATTPGTSEVDDGPNFFFRNYKDFDKVSRHRAERIGYEVLKQLYDETFEDITVYREYPNGPVKAVTPFPAGVIGKTTATNQKDFDTPYAYRLWYRHVTRLMGLVGYTLVGDIDDLDRKLSITQAKDLKTDETAQEPSSVNESKMDYDLTEVMDDISTVLDELMIGYEGEADKKKREKRLKKLRKQLDTTTPPLTEEKFDKLDFYLNYYKNLSPSNFTVQTKDENIVISLNQINEDVLNERSVNAGIYRGPIKVDGKSVEIEVELYGADNTNRTYKTRIMWVPPSLKNRFKVGQEFPIPAKAFHAPRMGSGWRRVKVSGMFENKVMLPKSLGIPRSKMPQVSSRNMSDYIQFLKSNGVVVKSKKFKVSDVKMTQKEINQDKVLGLMKGDNREHLAKPVVISKDGYIMDGHHRILALYNLDNDATINTIWVNLPIRKLLDITFDYPKVFTKTVEESISSITEAQQKLSINIPSDVRKIHQAFKKSGKKLYVVGGAVRDAILGKVPKDFDLATDAKPDEVVGIAKNNGLKYTEVGKAFGVVVVNDMEIATFRADIGKGRRPDKVEYTDIYGDVKRRDLTINALFYDLDRNEIVDLVGGIKDLQKNRIRTVGNAIERFDEDPLRKLRAIRFAARLGGKLERGTLEAITSDPSLTGVSEERVRDEFLKSIQSAKSVKEYLKVMSSTKLLHSVFPNMMWKPSDFIEEKNPVILIAYLFRKQDPTQLYKRLMGLKYTHDEANGVKFLVQMVDFTPDRVFQFKKMEETIKLTSTDIIRWGKLIGKDFTKFTKFRLSVSGNDVMGMGFKGKDIGVQISKMEADKYMNEDITIPIEVGDTILTGRFKNKKTKVNTIGKDEHGMPTVNGRKVVNFRKEKVDVNEAEFILKPGFTFVAQKTLGDIKRGVKYVIKGVDGAIGNLVFTLKPATKNELIPIKSRSYSEFYSKVMNLSEIIDPGEPETGYVPDGKERKLDDGRPEPWFKHLGFTQMDFPKADRMRGWGKNRDKDSSFRKVYYKTQNVKKNKLSDVLQPESPNKWKEVDK